MHHKDKMFLVAFGGNKKEPSNQVENAYLAMLADNVVCLIHVVL